MIDTSRCVSLRPGEPIGGARCQAPATHDSVLGRRCDCCAEVLRQALRRTNTLGNVLTGGRARTEEEIARLVVALPS
jgi:hypothetical protein